MIMIKSEMFKEEEPEVNVVFEGVSEAEERK